MKAKSLFFYLLLCVGLNFSSVAHAQTNPVGGAQIKTAKLFRNGDQTSFPALALGGSDQLQLIFDDFDTRIKNYYYTFQLCNADWTPTMLHPFEYIKGFQNQRITTYRNSSLATARYVHYQATLPDRNCYPSRSGNYLLKVFLDNDTAKLVFSKRFVVYSNQAVLSAQVQQPFNAQYFRTFQKLMIALQLDARLQVLSPSDVKVAVLQNNNWQTALFMNRPTINRGNYYEYSDEGITAMPGLKEFRWVDLRSLRLLSDRVERTERVADTQQLFVKPDLPRSGNGYVYYRDLNGAYTVETLDNVNPYWQGDYAKVHFRFAPPGNKPLAGSDLYLFGELTQYGAEANARMEFNAENGLYEKTLWLKQGYYSYAYFTKPANGAGTPDFSLTEGDHWATENAYTILVYYRPFGARADELIGFTSLNTAFQRTGF